MEENAQQLFALTGYRSIPVICGPTASAKTSLAIRVARELDGQICCCDSMQIYKHLSIGTAKPTREECALVPHHLIDLVEPDTSFHVASYLDAAYTKIEELLDSHILPVFCGGTGQYVSALQKGISFDEAPVDHELEEKYWEKYRKDGIDDIFEKLRVIDPKAAEKIHPNNTKRVIHTLALCESLGKTTEEIHKDSNKEGPRYPFTLFCIDWPRDELYQRINLRVDQMMNDGLLEEAKWLYDQKYEKNVTALQAIGYKEFFPYFDNRCTLEESISLLKQHTRNYAKRQLTWFRHLDGIHWISFEHIKDYSVKSFL
ncbi:MAG: tRNA (adenosine(37)-N6)-dimethylallyltransferase MiaA [Clostridiales bacterium]|nr:tRNA (adenosine(37)-N6)-dimethylallyltransferase MiaA [Clostridiales bacterium]